MRDADGTSVNLVDIMVSLDLNHDGLNGGVLISTEGTTALDPSSIRMSATRGSRVATLDGVPALGTPYAMMKEGDVLRVSDEWYTVSAHSSDDKYLGHDYHMSTPPPRPTILEMLKQRKQRLTLPTTWSNYGSADLDADQQTNVGTYDPTSGGVGVADPSGYSKLEITFLGTLIGTLRRTKSNCAHIDENPPSNTFKNCDGSTNFLGVNEPGAEITCCCLIGVLETDAKWTQL